MDSDSNDETNFPHKLLLTSRKVWKISKEFVNGCSAKCLRPLLKTGLILIK